MEFTAEEEAAAVAAAVREEDGVAESARRQNAAVVGAARRSILVLMSKRWGRSEGLGVGRRNGDPGAAANDSGSYSNQIFSLYV